MVSTHVMLLYMVTIAFLYSYKNIVNVCLFVCLFEFTIYDLVNLGAFNTKQRQSELPLSIPRNSLESDHGCTSRIYFDNSGDSMTLTLYNMTLTSRKPC